MAIQFYPMVPTIWKVPAAQVFNTNLTQRKSNDYENNWNDNLLIGNYTVFVCTGKY
jgi:hypothetical protein